MTDNVIQFPKAKMNTPPQSIEEMVADIDRLRRDHADEIINSMIPSIISMFASHGVDVDEYEYIKDVSMVMESTKALLYKYLKIEHPFHQMIDNIFDYSFTEDESVAYTYTLPSDKEEE